MTTMMDDTIQHQILWKCIYEYEFVSVLYALYTDENGIADVDDDDDVADDDDVNANGD